MYFRNETHRQNFLKLLFHFNVFGDREYCVACYVLACPEIFRKVAWSKCNNPFDFLKWRGSNRVDLSNGYRLLVEMAKNLFNDRNQFNLMEGLRTWDEHLRRIFLEAVNIRMGIKELELEDVS